MIEIVDFMDFNYERIAFDITGVSRRNLEKCLDRDFVNHLSRLEGANYIAIWNCDLQDFKSIEDIYFDSMRDDYILARLIECNGLWRYEIINSDMRVRENLRI